MLDALPGDGLSGETRDMLAWFLYYPALVIAAIFFIARLIHTLVRQGGEQGLFGIIQRTPLRKAVPVAVGMLFLAVLLPKEMLFRYEILLLSRYPVIALVAVFFSVHLLQSLIGGHGKLHII
ncbi:MAG: hypothetical protein OEV08_14510, partial [Nitrospira sp.]|nr:hypothetical protein [Nitrospira sp.]